MEGSNHLHIVDGDSIAGSLRLAIKAGSVPNGKIFSARNILAFGPLRHILDVESRREFLTSINHERLAQENLFATDAMFPNWAHAFQWDGSATVWWSSRSAFEHTLYLILLKHAPNVVDFDFVDVAAIDWESGHMIAGTGELNVDHLSYAFPLAARLSQNDIQSGRDRFDFLAEQDMPVRYVSDGMLIGGPIDVHDWRLRKYIGRKWRKAAYAIGYALGDQDNCHQVGDWFLFNRLRTLIQTGEIEARGDTSNMRGLQVRWPSATVEE